MTKVEMLNIIKLLSALESWGFSTKSPIPEFLFEQIGVSIELLSNEVLK